MHYALEIPIFMLHFTRKPTPVQISRPSCATVLPVTPIMQVADFLTVDVLIFNYPKVFTSNINSNFFIYSLNLIINSFKVESTSQLFLLTMYI